MTHTAVVFRDKPRPDWCWACPCGSSRVGYLSVDNAVAGAVGHEAKPPVWLGKDGAA